MRRATSVLALDLLFDPLTSTDNNIDECQIDIRKERVIVAVGRDKAYNGCYLTHLVTYLNQQLAAFKPRNVRPLKHMDQALRVQFAILHRVFALDAIAQRSK